MQVQTSMCCFCTVKKEGRKEGKGEKEEERKEYLIPPQTHHKANAPTKRANWTLSSPGPPAPTGSLISSLLLFCHLVLQVSRVDT